MRTLVPPRMVMGDSKPSSFSIRAVLLLKSAMRRRHPASCPVPYIERVVGLCAGKGVYIRFLSSAIHKSVPAFLGRRTC
eukprot:6569302-Heterocapsa_arctica.AAC.1